MVFLIGGNLLYSKILVSMKRNSLSWGLSDRIQWKFSFLESSLRLISETVKVAGLDATNEKLKF